MTNPREFWLHFQTAYGDTFSEEELQVNPDDLRVIEKSAYNLLQHRLDVAKAALEVISANFGDRYTARKALDILSSLDNVE